MAGAPVTERPWPADAIERRPTAALVPYARNARRHRPQQIAEIAASIKEWGWTVPALIDDQDTIIAGHGRILAAHQLGIVNIPVIVARDWTDAQKRAYRLADNKLALNAEWDLDMLAVELGDLQSSAFDLSLTGFAPTELADALGYKPGLTDPDEAPPLPEEPVSRSGDLWMLGRHRLLCGDATSADDVARVLDGVQPHLMVTDPPYGVMLDPSWRDRAGLNRRLAKAGRGGEHYMESGKKDVEARWDEVWKLSPADVFYIWCADRTLFDLHSALNDAVMEVRQILIWDKGLPTLTRTNYLNSHESCLYGVRKGKTASWVGMPGQKTVWQIPSPKRLMSGSKEEKQPHPAQKPVECMRRPIENNSSPGQTVYDPFVGSGTTIIAAEQTERTCHAIEISPAYVDVAVERWQNFTGKKAVREEAN